MADGAMIVGAGANGAVSVALKRANRHGLVAGATGTGKTVTLQVLAEEFSRAGVPVLAADVKGDLSGIAAPGAPPPQWAVARQTQLGLPPLEPAAAPTVFWDVYGQNGHPLRTTVSEMGPLLLARVLELTPAQEGALTIAFKVADDGDMPLLDLKDLRALLTHVAENAAEIGKTLGLVSTQSVAAIQRRLLQLEVEGADSFFGEPAFAIDDLMRIAPDGRGVVNVLAAEKLVHAPRLYATFMLWLMAELWEQLPEVGDLDKPKLVFFFDEAHLLFDGAPKPLLDRIEQVARLIRSKGVGVYFVTQSPSDIPDAVLAQLGNRFQHALRAYTPADQKAVRAAAASFRAESGMDVAREIQELGVGEALVSTLDDKGAPTPVVRAMVRPPRSRVGPLDPDERRAVMKASGFDKKYGKPIDRESAYEILQKRAAKAAKAAEREAKAETRAKPTSNPSPRRRARSTPAERVGGRVASNVLGIVARELMRGLFGTMKRR